VGDAELSPGEVTESRRVALEVLRAVREGDFADRALARFAARLERRDQAWSQELIYGTLRLRGRLDHLLTAFVRSGLDSLDPDVLDVLRLGVYQLLEMGGVPEYAAVSQSVELVRVAGSPRAAGLVNGVLQSVRRGWREVGFPDFDEDPNGYLATWGSHPRWLVDRWVDRWGADEARRLVEANNARPDLYVSPVGMTVEEAIEAFGERGIPVEPVPGFPDSVRIPSSATPGEALAVVPSVVQDPAAAAVARYAAVPTGGVLLDLSAAPGGKAAVLAGWGHDVVASDVSVARLRRVRTNVERTGLRGRVHLAVADARNPPYRAVEAVLLDAPCAGTGTLRRHADARWRLREADLAELAELQRALLRGAASLVAPGGLLVYSTCSIEPEENESQVEWFLSEHREFTLAAPNTGLDGTMLQGGCLVVLPHRHGSDGAFAARFQRIE
jgi:16S rRNA (cytosine967-C5)-methyltransferase